MVLCLNLNCTRETADSQQLAGFTYFSVRTIPRSVSCVWGGQLTTGTGMYRYSWLVGTVQYVLGTVLMTQNVNLHTVPAASSSPLYLGRKTIHPRKERNEEAKMVACQTAMELFSSSSSDFPPKGRAT